MELGDDIEISVLSTTAGQGEVSASGRRGTVPVFR
jgi:hypothetical protein